MWMGAGYEIVTINEFSVVNTVCPYLPHTEITDMQYEYQQLRLVGWEINVPFQHKYRVYQQQGLGFSRP